MNDNPDFMMQTYIRTSPERLWAALTDEHESAAYHFLGAATRTACEKGGRFDQGFPDGTLMLGGKIIDVEPNKRLEVTFEPNWGENPGAVSRYVCEIDHLGDHCCLTVSHYDLIEDQEGVADGWARQLSSLKSYLETGQKLKFAA